MLVILGHLCGTRNFPLALMFFKPYANVGVRIFFVISGYLITRLLLQERERTGRTDLLEFYRRRAFRIFPAAYLYMVIVAAFSWSSLSRRDLFAAFSYLSCYFDNHWSLGHLWSLSVEEQFYLLWPLSLAIGFVARRRIALFAIAFSPVLRVAFHFLHLPNRGYYFPTVLDALATGCLLALIWPLLKRYDRFLLSRAALVLPAIVIAVPMLVTFGGWYGEALYEVFGLTLMHMAIAGCIYNAIQQQWRCLNVRPMIWLGVISYGLYLWQQPFLRSESAEWWTIFPLNVLLALLCAELSHRWIEKPFLALRDRKRTPIIVPADAAFSLVSPPEK